jgi:hypothetical protein
MTTLLMSADCGGAERTSVDPHLAAHLREAHSFTGFPLYWAGIRLGKLPLTYVGSFAEHSGQAYSFDYGTCIESGEEHTCTDPMEIQITPLCNRLPRDIGIHKRSGARLRGALTSVAEAGSDNGGDFSLYVQGATITIYGWNHKLDMEAVAALRGANRLAHASAGEPLPAATAKQVAGAGC